METPRHEQDGELFLGNFADSDLWPKPHGTPAGREQLRRAFEIPPSALDGARILLAWYGYGDYDGEAFVVFERDGRLYEVNGNHCSCNGLEGCWEPEETTVEALRDRMDKGTLGASTYSEGGRFADDLRRVLGLRTATAA